MAAMGIEAGGIEYRIVGAEEAGDGGLEFAMQVLSAADEAHGGEAEAVIVERLVRRAEDLGMVGEAEIIVGAEVEDVLPGGEVDVGALRSGDDALVLVESVAADLGELVGEALLESHGRPTRSPSRGRPCRIGRRP